MRGLTVMPRQKNVGKYSTPRIEIKDIGIENGARVRFSAQLELTSVGPQDNIVVLLRPLAEYPQWIVPCSRPVALYVLRSHYAIETHPFSAHPYFFLHDIPKAISYKPCPISTPTGVHLILSELFES